MLLLSFVCLFESSMMIWVMNGAKACLFVRVWKGFFFCWGWLMMSPVLLMLLLLYMRMKNWEWRMDPIEGKHANTYKHTHIQAHWQNRQCHGSFVFNFSIFSSFFAMFFFFSNFSAAAFFLPQTVLSIFFYKIRQKVREKEKKREKEREKERETLLDRLFLNNTPTIVK